MEIGQARNFLAIAAHGSFLEAAKRLHITQSSVSARIQNLEDELGARLFERNRAGASLRVGRRIALWEELLPAWVSWMRQTAPG
ncbi:MAG: LysR family transcriptional regulator, partial [Chromatiales bacterium]